MVDIDSRWVTEEATSLSNWGRWGPDDEIGTWNPVTPEKIKEAASLSMSRSSLVGDQLLQPGVLRLEFFKLFRFLAFMPPYWASQRCHVDSATSSCRHTSVVVNRRRQYGLDVGLDSYLD
jgi:hypothetical protein